MATLMIEVTQNTAARLEREAQRRGMDLPTYVRRLLGDDDRGEGKTQPVLVDVAESVSNSRWPGSLEAVVTAIRDRGPDRTMVQEETADLAELLRSGGVDPGISSEEWDRRWAAYEAEQKAQDLADTEKTLREIREVLEEKDSKS